jgi:hypothetical protein
MQNTMNIGLSEINSWAVVTDLTNILADEFLLYTKTRNAHTRKQRGFFAPTWMQAQARAKSASLSENHPLKTLTIQPTFTSSKY